MYIIKNVYELNGVIHTCKVIQRQINKQNDRHTNRMTDRLTNWQPLGWQTNVRSDQRLDSNI